LNKKVDFMFTVGLWSHVYCAILTVIKKAIRSGCRLRLPLKINRTIQFRVQTSKKMVSFSSIIVLARIVCQSFC